MSPWVDQVIDFYVHKNKSELKRRFERGLKYKES